VATTPLLRDTRRPRAFFCVFMYLLQISLSSLRSTEYTTNNQQLFRHTFHLCGIFYSHEVVKYTVQTDDSTIPPTTAYIGIYRRMANSDHRLQFLACSLYLPKNRRSFDDQLQRPIAECCTQADRWLRIFNEE